MVNATIKIDVSRLGNPRDEIYCARWKYAYLKLIGTPKDLDTVVFRIFKDSAAFFDVNAEEESATSWRVVIPPAAVPDKGVFKYEIHATMPDGATVALGWGRVIVSDFSQGGNETQVGEIQQVVTVPCADGGRVAIEAVYDGFEYVLSARKLNT